MEYRLMHYLASNRGRVVTKDELLNIARTLMELMGGKLVIERPEKGFCAALFIPLA